MEFLARRLFCLSLFSTAATCAHAFEQDTHFQVTFVVCRAAGMTDVEALKVAAVDEGMDDSAGTVANGGAGGAIPNVPEEYLWHALDKDGRMGPKGILERKELLFKTALTRSTVQDKLFYLGVFFHYQGDTWAHRHHYDGNPHTYDDFTTYNTPFGHARHGHQPDRPPFDPVTALASAEDGIQYASKFIREALGRTPRTMWDGYQVKPGTVDDGWDDHRRGKYFHQLASDGESGTARRFLTDLIRAQINCYTSSTDANPFFFPRSDADKVDLDQTRMALTDVCASYKDLIGETITVPTTEQKEAQGFTNMNSKSLLEGMNG